LISFKLLTLNAHHGVGIDSKYDFVKLCQDIADLECDVICLQELDAYAIRTRFNNQPKIISNELGFNLAKSRVRFFGAGNQYNAIVSKFDFISSFSATLPKASDGQVRKALLSVIDIEGVEVGITSTHLHTHGTLVQGAPKASKQLEHIYKNAKIDVPHVVAGDFNLLPDSVLPIAEKYEFVAPSEYPTSPAKEPRNQIDWITGRNVEITDVKVTDLLPSDHRGLLATISL